MATKQFHSTEAIAAHLDGSILARDAVPSDGGSDPAMAALREVPLLPLDKDSQTLQIGTEAAMAARIAQQRARGLLTNEPLDSAYAIKFLWRHRHRQWMSEYVGDAKLSVAEWAKKAIVDVAILTRNYCNHICMKQVCHKGRLGKRGLCRLGFWHTKHVKTKQKKQNTRNCSLQLNKSMGKPW